jgi:hypothetical protein
MEGVSGIAPRELEWEGVSRYVAPARDVEGVGQISESVAPPMAYPEKEERLKEEDGRSEPGLRTRQTLADWQTAPMLGRVVGLPLLSRVGHPEEGRRRSHLGTYL